MSGSFTLTGRLMHPDKVTPLVDEHIRLLASAFPDPTDNIVYTSGVDVVTDANGSFSVVLLTEASYYYTITSMASPPVFTRVTFAAPATGITLDLSALVAFDPTTISSTVLSDAIAARNAAQAAAASVAYSTWQASTAYALNQTVQAPDGSLIKANSARTSRASFDATEQTFWTTVGAVAGTLQRVALDGAYASVTSVKKYGATGDGTTNDTAAFVSTIATGAKNLYVPPGTYVVTGGVLMNQANQTLTLASGVTLKGPQTLIEMSAAGVSVVGYGATMDGTSTGTTSGTAIYAHAANQRVAGLSFVNCAGYGINAQGDQVSIVENTCTNGGSAGIIVQNATTSVDLTAPYISGNRVTVAAGTSYGIQVHVNGSRTIYRPRVVNNDVTLPATATSGIGIEIQGGGSTRFGQVTGNTVEGGYTGISIDHAVSTSVTGNSIHGPYIYCLELALVERCAASGNSVDGNGISAYGISVTNTGVGFCTISGNTIGNLKTSTRGIGVYAQNTSNHSITITGNNIVAGLPIYIQNDSGHVVVGNTLTGVTAASSTNAVELDNITNSIVAYNTVALCPTSAVTAFSGTMNDLVIGPNVIHNGTTVDLGAAWTPGTNGVGSRYIRGNKSVGGTNVATVTASPWTFTNVTVNPLMIYIKGGTVSNITKNGQSLTTSTPAAVMVQSGESIVVTYTVAPTAYHDQF